MLVGELPDDASESELLFFLKNIAFKLYGHYSVDHQWRRQVGSTYRTKFFTSYMWPLHFSLPGAATADEYKPSNGNAMRISIFIGKNLATLFLPVNTELWDIYCCLHL